GLDQRADGVPRRGAPALGEGGGRVRGLAQLLRAHRLPLARACAERAASGRAARPARGRPRLPARAAVLVQPQVLPGVAAAVSLHREAERPAARRPRVPARRAAARPAGAVAPTVARVTLD